MEAVVRAVVLGSIPALFLGLFLEDATVTGVSVASLAVAWAASPAAAGEAFRKGKPVFMRCARAALAVAFFLIGSLVFIGGFAIGRAWVMTVAATAVLIGAALARNSVETAFTAVGATVRTRRATAGRKYVLWGDKKLSAKHVDQKFFRVYGTTGTGKSTLTKKFVLEVIEELKTNPHAKLVIFDPKREFYAWLLSLKLPKHIPVRLFLASDRRCVPLAFERDYDSDQDAQAFAYAFHPHDPNEKSRFWADTMRTIYGAVFSTARERLGYVDLRIMCLILEDVELTRTLLGYDPYYKAARDLVALQGSTVNEALQNIRLTIASRITEMKVIASHLAEARNSRDPFSLREFIRSPQSGILVVSVDKAYELTQEPMNALLMHRLFQLLEHEQSHPRRKVFVVVDELQQLAGRSPCPGIDGLFERLRNRGVVAYITAHSKEAVQVVYGERMTKVIEQNCRVTMDLSEAGPTIGIKGKASRPQLTRDWLDGMMYLNKSWEFSYNPSFFKKIPETHPGLKEHEYDERPKSEQKLKPLTMEERRLLGLSVATHHGGVETKEAAADVIALLCGGGPETPRLILQDEKYYRMCWREASKRTHPDRGGNAEHFIQLQAAKAVLDVFYKKGR